MRKPLTLFLTAFALAAVSLLVTILTSPPKSIAGPAGTIDVYSIGLIVPQDLPEFEQEYRRHTGVLDRLP